MAEYISTPNILWSIENFSEIYKKLGPEIKFLGLKFHIGFSQYVESGVEKIQLYMEHQNVSQTLPWQFKVEVNIVHNSYSYLSKSGNYNLKHNEWRIWTDSISAIHKTIGKIKSIKFLIMITPIAGYGTLFTKESAVETNEMTPCAMSFSEDIGNLFNNIKHSDFTLKCGNKSFFVHKAILSARSQFFAGMFESDWRETNEKEGKIENIEPDILDIVLCYLYTGELPPLPADSLQKVYSAADRFIVDPLKRKCYTLFIDILNRESNDDSEKGTGNEQSEKEKNDKKRLVLKDLFTSREWRLFSEEFPSKAHEICKSYIL